MQGRRTRRLNNSSEFIKTQVNTENINSYKENSISASFEDTQTYRQTIKLTEFEQQSKSDQSFQSQYHSRKKRKPGKSLKKNTKRSIGKSIKNNANIQNSQSIEKTVNVQISFKTQSQKDINLKQEPQSDTVQVQAEVSTIKKRLNKKKIQLIKPQSTNQYQKLLIASQQAMNKQSSTKTQKKRRKKKNKDVQKDTKIVQPEQQAKKTFIKDKCMKDYQLIDYYTKVKLQNKQTNENKISEQGNGSLPQVLQQTIYVFQNKHYNYETKLSHNQSSSNRLFWKKELKSPQKLMSYLKKKQEQKQHNIELLPQILKLGIHQLCQSYHLFLQVVSFYKDNGDRMMIIK